MAAKILVLDIENAPNLAYVWKLWQENVHSDLFVKSNHIMSWSAKFVGEDKMYFDSLGQSTKRHMLKGIYNLLNKADVVVHYNGKRHDMPFLNREFLEEGFSPPSTYKEIDLFTTVKNRFKFPSNRLDYVCKALGLGKKADERGAGYELWTDCLNGVRRAWDDMRKYNQHDVTLTEAVYLKLRPWIKNHPNIALYESTATRCPHCASKQFKDAGFIAAKNNLYQQFKCLRSTCGTYFKATKSLGPVAGKKFSTI